MLFKYKSFKVLVVVTFCTILTIVNLRAEREVLVNWRFEHIKHLKGDSLSISIVGQALTAGNRGPAEPQPFVFDDSGKGNFLQAQGSKSSAIVFSDNVPSTMVNGKPNTGSLALKNGEYVVPFDRPLAYYDMQKSWSIEATLKCNLLGTEQVYLCKEGARGQLAGDVSIGFDNMYKKYFIEVMCADGV